MFEIETIWNFDHKNYDYVNFVWFETYEYTCNDIMYFILFQCITMIGSEKKYDFGKIVIFTFFKLKT